MKLDELQKAWEDAVVEAEDATTVRDALRESLRFAENRLSEVVKREMEARFKLRAASQAASQGAN